ncbi:MAG: portal protein, partial [Geminicoccaceae bacterium]
MNYSARSLELAPRITEEQEAYPNEIVEKVRMNLWRDVELGRPQEAEDDEAAPHDILEQHRTLDLDDDGYAEPYIVTVHKETSQVLRIVARFEEDGILLNKAGEVAKIEAEHYYVKYPFIPSPDGGFYDIGLGSLLKGIGGAIDSALNQMMDAGTLQNMGGGFVGKGLRLKSGPMRIRPGEWKPVDNPGSNVKDNVVPFPAAGPSPVLFNLLGLLIEAGRDITSVKDVMTGDEGPTNEAATRTLARIEQGMKVFTAIYKRIYRSWGRELKMLFRLNQLFLNPETYFTLLDEPEAVSPTDYDPDDLDIVPVADPSTITDMQRLGRAEFLLGFIDDPLMDPREIRQRILDAANIPDTDKLMPEGDPAPPPEVAEAADKMDIEKRKIAIDAMEKAGRMEIDQAKALAEIAEIESKMILNLAKAEAEEGGPQMAIYQEQMRGLIEQVKSESQFTAEKIKA